ncbi:hypothetical protein ACFQL7_06475 [Halocatena marina]|uniref:Uncharacterized protein n=1 Tax=Halocatena marina TaxID=2934937 RepID=A0ABD5YJX7_9EURY|nr:hypothetical protein [Halocatena marina]
MNSEGGVREDCLVCISESDRINDTMIGQSRRKPAGCIRIVCWHTGGRDRSRLSITAIERVASGETKEDNETQAQTKVL